MKPKVNGKIVTVKAPAIIQNSAPKQLTKTLSHSKRTFNLHDIPAIKIESQPLPNDSDIKQAPNSTIASMQQSLTTTGNQKSSTARAEKKVYLRKQSDEL